MALHPTFIRRYTSPQYALAEFMGVHVSELTRDDLLAIIGYQQAQHRDQRKQHEHDLDVMAGK